MEDYYTSLTEIGATLILSVPSKLDDQGIEAMTEAVLERAHGRRFSGAILDFSALRIMDSFEFSAYIRASKALELMGIRVCWTGLSPSSVITIMDSEMDLYKTSIQTAVNLEEGLDLLRGDHVR